MLTSLFQELLAQLSVLDMPVYLEDCVPDGAVFPYATAKVEPSLSSQNSGLLTLIIWSRSDAPNAERITEADNLLAFLPARGLRLTTEEGALLLRLKSPALCLQEQSVRGLKTQWQLIFIPSV